MARDTLGPNPDTLAETYGIELAYAELASAFTTASAGGVAVTGLAFTFVAPARPYMVEFSAPWSKNTTANAFAQVYIIDGVAPAGTPLATNAERDVTASGLYVSRRIGNVVAGTQKSYWISLNTVGGGTASIEGGSSVATFRAYMV